MRASSQAGLTLVEMLVAVSLLSVLSVGMLMAMRLGFRTMDRVDEHLAANRRVVNTRGIIENEVDGFVLTTAAYGPPEAVMSVPFLQTEARIVRFVTSYSLEDGWRGRPQIAVLQVIPGDVTADDRRPSVRLILNETPYTGSAQAGENITGIEQDPVSGSQIVHFAPVPAGPKSFVLADRLAFCRFSYLQPLPQPPFQIWRPDWVLPRQMPVALRIEMAPLDISPSGLHVTTVTVPMHITRAPGTNYAD